MLQILLVTFPFFALVLLGYLATQARVLPREAIGGLNSFVLYFALPCMLYRFGARTPIAQLLDVRVASTWLACALIMVTFTVLTTRRGAVGWNDAAFGALVATFPNSGFMGVPLLATLVGAASAAPVIVTLTIDMVITSSLCVALSRLDTMDEHGVRRAAVHALRGMALNPLPWSILLGCLSSATGWSPPAPVATTVGLLADAASPTALFTIGAVLARPRARAPAQDLGTTGAVAQLVLYKLLVHPTLVLSAGALAAAVGRPVPHTALVAMTLLAALPSASNVPMLAERFGADTARVARVVMISTALAFLTFSLAVAWLV